MIIDLNSDLGEGWGVYRLGDDEAMLRTVTSANIACGFHAGDPLVMAATLEAAAANGVGLGAHPSFLDPWGFGRRPILGESPAAVEKQLVYQIGALQALAHSAGQTLSHVKTHGALNNMANEDEGLALAVARAVRSVDRELILVVMPGLASERAGERLGLSLAREIFADRAYTEAGALVSRRQEGSVIHDAEAAAARVLRMLESQAIETAGGGRIPARIDTVCVHGDTPGAVAMAERLRARLEAAGVDLAPMREVVARA